MGEERSDEHAVAEPGKGAIGNLEFRDGAPAIAAIAEWMGEAFIDDANEVAVIGLDRIASPDLCNAVGPRHAPVGTAWQDGAGEQGAADGSAGDRNHLAQAACIRADGKRRRRW